MRKYTQLGLVIICLLSVGGLLVMERRYSHMKVFLEVTDLFQTSDAKVKCHKQMESLRTTLEGAYLDQTHRVEPNWRQTASSSFVYSAFYLANDTKATILLVASTKPTLCRLWFEGRAGPQTESSVRIISSAGDLSAMQMNCTNANATATPQAVEVDGVLLPLETVPPPAPAAGDSVAICIRSLTVSAEEIRLAEFLTYYSHLGVTDFYAYDQSLSSAVKTAMRRAGFIDTSLRVQLLAWNTPALMNSSLTDAVLKADCLLRSATTSKFTAVMGLDEFFVMRREPANIRSFLATVLRPGQVLAVHERFFCDEFPDDVIAAALDYPFVTLRKTRFTRNAVQHRLSFTYAGSLATLDSLVRGGMVHSASGAVSYVSEQSGHINRYTPCSQMHFWLRKNNLLQQPQQGDKAATQIDTHLTRLHEILFGSKLYKQAVHGNGLSVAYRLIA